MCQDTELLGDILRTELNYLQSSWKGQLGRPTVVVTVKSQLLGKAIGNRVLSKFPLYFFKD